MSKPARLNRSPKGKEKEATKCRARFQEHMRIRHGDCSDRPGLVEAEGVEAAVVVVVVVGRRENAVLERSHSRLIHCRWSLTACDPVRSTPVFAGTGLSKERGVDVAPLGTRRLVAVGRSSQRRCGAKSDAKRNTVNCSAARRSGKVGGCM
jgi:hypothetical protein